MPVCRGAVVVGALLLVGCAATQIAVVPGASNIRTGTQTPGGTFQELGAITATHGSGCGAFGSRGNYEGAYSVLRNKAASLGADYVQILRVTEPYFAQGCFHNSYTIDAIAYRITGPATAPARDTARPTGLQGTYTGDITGNAQGRVFNVRITFTIVQSGNQFAGSWTTSGGAAGTVKGLLSESGIREWEARQLQPCPGDFGGVAVLEAGGDKLTGSYVGSDCNGGVTASFAVFRQ